MFGAVFIVSLFILNVCGLCISLHDPSYQWRCCSPFVNVMLSYLVYLRCYLHVALMDTSIVTDDSWGVCCFMLTRFSVGLLSPLSVVFFLLFLLLLLGAYFDARRSLACFVGIFHSLHGVFSFTLLLIHKVFCCDPGWPTYLSLTTMCLRQQINKGGMYW